MADERRRQKGGRRPKLAPRAASRRQGRPPAKEAQGQARRRGGAAAPRTPRPADYKPRMKLQYEKVVRAKLTKQFGYKNPMQIPRLEKIVLNMGVGEAVNDRKKVENAAEAIWR